MKFKVKKLYKDALLPKKSGPLEAGWDLFLYNKQLIAPGAILRAETGISIQLPEGYYGDIRPRSSAFGKGLMTSGTLDCTYTGHVYVQLINLSKETIYLEAGKAYAQMVISKYSPEIDEVEEVSVLESTYRGDKGFGSSNH